MKERIVVPLDGSALAEMALPHAVSLARATSRALILLRVVPIPPSFSQVGWTIPPSQMVWSEWEAEPALAREYLARTARLLTPLPLEVHTDLLDGDPARAIVQYAEEHPWVTTIAMSTHGHGGLGRLVFGSVADKVLHDSPVPVLLVRGKENPIREGELVLDGVSYGTILVPLDGSPLAEQALERAMPIAQATGARLVLVSAVPDDPIFADLVSSFNVQSMWDREFDWRRDYLKEMETRLRQEGLEVESHVLYRPPVDAILQTADSKHADLIVMSTHGRGGFKRLWLGSVAGEVVRHAEQPVLLIRAASRVDQPASQAGMVSPGTG
jgi:nucleotide-binding universal stress UspA family protein